MLKFHREAFLPFFCSLSLQSRMCTQLSTVFLLLSWLWFNSFRSTVRISWARNDRDCTWHARARIPRNICRQEWPVRTAFLWFQLSWKHFLIELSDLRYHQRKFRVVSVHNFHCIPSPLQCGKYVRFLSLHDKWIFVFDIQKGDFCPPSTQLLEWIFLVSAMLVYGKCTEQEKVMQVCRGGPCRLDKATLENNRVWMAQCPGVDYQFVVIKVPPTLWLYVHLFPLCVQGSPFCVCTLTGWSPLTCSVTKMTMLHS